MGHFQVANGQVKIFFYLKSIRKVTDEIEGCWAVRPLFVSGAYLRIYLSDCLKILHTPPLGGLVVHFHLLLVQYYDLHTLWFKLINTGIHGRVLKVLRSMYLALKSCVRTPEGITNFF